MLRRECCEHGLVLNPQDARGRLVALRYGEDYLVGVRIGGTTRPRVHSNKNQYPGTQ
jgi:hypothetical protein